MEFSKLVQTRYSVRKFQNTPIPQDVLDRILEAGRIAPSASNRQPQRILVIRSTEAREKLKPCTPCHFDAPVILLACCDRSAGKEKIGSEVDFGRVDVSIALTQIMLTATDLGVGTVWVGMFDPAKLRAAFHVPKQYEIVSLMPMGYPAEDAAPNARLHNARYPMEHMVTYNTF